MATRQSVGQWAAVLAAAFLLWVPGLDSKGSEPILKEITIQIGENVSMKLALIPAGKFMMGSPPGEANRSGEEPQHEVALSKPFYMGVTEVTQAQYEAVMGTNPSNFKGATNPVESVSWNDAADFCRKLSEKTGKTVRLPAEAEWEYACRAGTTTRFSFGDEDSVLGDYAWYDSNIGGTTHPVGQKKPNAWGLFDMHGNVWEWCADWYGDYPKGAVTDPQGPASGPNRVLRGGSWNDVRGTVVPRAAAGAVRAPGTAASGSAWWYLFRPQDFDHPLYFCAFTLCFFLARRRMRLRPFFRRVSAGVGAWLSGPTYILRGGSP